MERKAGRQLVAYGKRKRQKGKAAQTLYSMKRVLMGLLALAAILIAIVVVTRHEKTQEGAQRVSENLAAEEPEMEVALLTVNAYSRPGVALEEINGIVIHYTANPGTSAQANRDYFEGLKDSHVTKASAHFVVGLEGEIVQCIPTSEIAYASNDRNRDTISIECCYQNEDGSFEQATYDSVIRLTAWLCAREGLSADDVIRHYDVTGKLCPLYYVENPDAWDTFRADVAVYIEKYLENAAFAE